VAHIDAFLRGVTTQTASGFDLEILVADGESDDGTLEVLAAWRAKEPRLKVISNPRRIVSTGLNAALHLAQGGLIVRMDVHAEYAEDYVAKCVKALEESGAMCVGGPIRPKGRSFRQRAIAAAYSSAFGCGGAKSRRTDYTGPIDTVFLGAWRRADLIALGGFDEELVRSQDDELCLRITRSGGIVWQSSAIQSSYLPRESLAGLWHQFYQYGYWKAAVITKHRLLSSIRQLVPTLFLSLLFAVAFVGIFAPRAWLLMAGLLIAYATTAGFAARAASKTHQPSSSLLVFLCFPCMHFAYALGWAHGVLDFLILCREPAPRMSDLSR